MRVRDTKYSLQILVCKKMHSRAKMMGVQHRGWKKTQASHCSSTSCLLKRVILALTDIVVHIARCRVRKDVGRPLHSLGLLRLIVELEVYT